MYALATGFIGMGLKDKKIAVMGCIVNGPGEARDADFGIAGGRGEGLWFEKGEIIGKIPQNKWLKKFTDKIKKGK